MNSISRSVPDLQLSMLQNFEHKNYKEVYDDIAELFRVCSKPDEEINIPKIEFETCKLEADNGNMYALATVGICNELIAWKFRDRDRDRYYFKKAFKCFELAAKQGHAPSQEYLGYHYDLGMQVVQNKSEAAKWFRLAAEQGISNAQNKLGICYAEGHGVEVNLGEAIKWYKKAIVDPYYQAALTAKIQKMLSFSIEPEELPST